MIKTEEFIERAKLVHNNEYDYLDEYSGCKNDFLMRHKVCGYIFKKSPDHHINRKDTCPRCNKKEKLTNEIIDERLLKDDRKIKRIGSIINCKTNIEWRCLECSRIWLATPSSVLNNETGCPECHGTERLTNDIIDKRLIETDKNIKRIGNYINNHTKISWRCLVNGCGYVWKTSLSSILNTKSGCSRCSNKEKRNNENVDTVLDLEKRNIKRIEDVNGVFSKINWQCKICDNIWKTTPDSILNQKSGCPECGGTKKLTNEILDCELLKNLRNIKRIDNYVNIHTKISWKCLKEKCGYIWATTPANILNHETGCPKCNSSKGELEIIKFCKRYNILFEYQKSFNDCRNPKTGYKLWYDFYFPTQNILLEYDGEQHDKLTSYISGKIFSKPEQKKNLESQKYRDKIKELYPFTKNIKFFRISHKDNIISKMKEILEIK